jgi:hypothetical protein
VGLSVEWGGWVAVDVAMERVEALPQAVEDSTEMEEMEGEGERERNGWGEALSEGEAGIGVSVGAEEAVCAAAVGVGKEEWKERLVEVAIVLRVGWRLTVGKEQGVAAALLVGRVETEGWVDGDSSEIGNGDKVPLWLALTLPVAEAMLALPAAELEGAALAEVEKIGLMLGRGLLVEEEEGWEVEVAEYVGGVTDMKMRPLHTNVLASVVLVILIT